MPDEDPAEFEAFIAGIRRDPVLSRHVTNKQIREYADAKWHLRRADRALFILLEYGQEHPMEAIPQIHAVIKARSKYSRTRNVLFHKLYPFKRI